MHSNSEGFRLSKTKIIINEQIRLLLWSLNNLNPLKEKILLIYKYFSLNLKSF